MLSITQNNYLRTHTGLIQCQIIFQIIMWGYKYQIYLKIIIRRNCRKLDILRFNQPGKNFFFIFYIVKENVITRQVKMVPNHYLFSYVLLI